MSFSVKKLRDSLDDDDVSDDVDDEVFIRDGRTFKLDDDRGLKRPLMAPRRKFKSTSSYFSYGESKRLKRLRAPFCVTLVCVIILCCLIALALVLINMNTSYMLNKLIHPSREFSSDSLNKPCTDYEVEELWHYTIPKIKSETPVRSVDVNADGIEDVIIGYETGADQVDLPLFTCQMYFGLPGPCAGGVLALDGRTGTLLWQKWLQKSILKLDCSYDITQDDVNDCLISGESGLMCILNGKTGDVVWCLSHSEADLYRSAGGLLDFYAGQFIPDVNQDGVVDVLTAHTNGSSASMMGSHVAILSGVSGEVLHRLTSPVSGEMLLSAPHILVKPDGEAVVVFCTVHNNAPTSIYVVAMSGLINGQPERVKTIYSDIQGLAASPILIDMNDDQTEDIVVTSKSKLLIFDGLNYTLLLNVSYPFDDSYEHDVQFAPVPGYFNNDSISDFFLTYSVGSTEFLYYSVSTVLDGKTGKSLLPAPIIRSNIPDTSGITLSSPGFGNDAFIYWLSSCVNFETYQDDYRLSGRSFEVDICNARFNTSTEIKLMLLSQHVTSPGIVLYSSSTNFETEINGTANVLGQVEEYIKLHPEVKKEIEYYQMQKLTSSPAKCSAALDALQRSETPDFSYNPNSYDPDMIPDPVPRAYPRERYPVDTLNPQYPNIDPDFPSPEDDTRDRDERDENTQPDEPDTSDDDSETLGDSDAARDKTRNVVTEKNTGSKEVMPRRKRSSNKINPRRKRKIEDDIRNVNKMNKDLKNRRLRFENSFKLDMNEERDDNHGGEEFDETEFTKQMPKETEDENHGGETIDDYDQDERELDIQHDLNYENGDRGIDKEIYEEKVGNMEERDEVLVESVGKVLSAKRGKRHKQREYEEDDEDENDNDEDDSEDNDENEDDSEDNEDDSEDDKSEEEDDDDEEDDRDEANGEDETEERDRDEEPDDEQEEDDDDEENERNRRQLDKQFLVGNADTNRENNKRRLSRKRRSLPQSTRFSRNHNFATRQKYYHGPNHKKKTSMQEKWWKYIMMTNSEDWQTKRKSILREENKLKEDKRKLEERQGNVDGTYIQNRTKELERKHQQLKEEEEMVMKHIPNKKMINLDEQFLNYVKKSLGLKNNDSSISNYDVDDVEELWDDFIETNVLNHRGFGEDYEFDNAVKEKRVATDISKDNPKDNRFEDSNNNDFNKNNIYHYENSKHMVSYNLHADNKEESKPLNDSVKEKLTSTNQTVSSNNVEHIEDGSDLQQKVKHYTTLDQLKLINRIIKNNKTKHNRVVKNESTLDDKASLENGTNNNDKLKVILKNGENFKYNDYFKWKDNSEYVNFDSYYNILKLNENGDSNGLESNELNSKKKVENVTSKQKIVHPSKLFTLKNNQTNKCNSYFFKRRLKCESNMKKNTQSVVGKKQKSSKKIHKKLHEKVQTNLGIKHIVVNNTKSNKEGRAFVIEKINYKFPFNFGKEKIYSEKDLELFFNNETHSEIKKIMKINMRKINDSISKIKNASRNKSDHHQWSNVNYFKSHKLIRNKSNTGESNNDSHLDHQNTTKEHGKQKSNNISKEMWFDTLHSLKTNKQFLKHLKSTSYKSNRVTGKHSDEDSNDFDSEDFNNMYSSSEHNADLITKKIDLQNNIEKMHISELKNSKNKTHKLFPYRRRDKDKTNNDNRIENLFGLTDSMISNVNQTTMRVNKTENNLLGLPVGGRYSSHLTWHEKTQYGLPLKNKWETTTEILLNSQRHHRLMKVKKRSIHFEDNIPSSSKFKKRSTVKKDLSVTLIGLLKSNQTNHLLNTEPQFKLGKDESNTSAFGNLNTIRDHLNEKTNENFDLGSQNNNVGSGFSGQEIVVKRSIEKYLKILPRAASTPLLMNSIATNDSSSVDIIFVSFWVPPKADIKKLTISQLECVRQKVLRAKSINCFNEFDDLLIEEEMAKQCISMDDTVGESEARGENIEFNPYNLQGDSQSPFYNPFNLRFGQLSVYRVRIKCKQCGASVFEMMQRQGWPSGNGQMSNGVFIKKQEHGK